ncbi:MAG: 30S processome protein Utp24 [Desulfurococcales archaeon]|nr:30S processome protein Utp24 [Desulfurococcales archaeon]
MSAKLPKKCRVLLDTSVLLMLYDGIDVIEEIEDSLNVKCEFYTPTAVVNELLKLKDQRSGWRSRAAAIALQYIEGRVEVVEHPPGRKCSTADEAIVDIARVRGDEFIYATVDRELKQKLRELKVPVLTWWLGRRRFVIVA